MSDEKVSLELHGARVLSLTAEVRDLQVRFTAMEHRFAALETRFAAMEARLSGIEGRLGGLEERISATLSLIVRIAERLDGGSPLIRSGDGVDATAAVAVNKRSAPRHASGAPTRMHHQAGRNKNLAAPQ
jgi:alpha-D-ribose 1-methylphosphonate 5-triphosphate synthase subunit PhnH